LVGDRKKLQWGASEQSFKVSVHSPLIIPWKQLINSVDLVVCDAAQGIGEPGLRIDAVQLGGLNQGIDDGCELPPRSDPTNM
jgi:hypothetical protein